MIDAAYWQIAICDLCSKDLSALEPRLVGIMENGSWVGGFSQENLEKSRPIFAQWEKEITGPCIVIWADMEHITICEKHLAEIVAKKEEQLKNNNG